MRIQIIIISLVVFLILPSEQAIGQQGQEGVNPYSLAEKVLVENSLVSFFEKCNCLDLITTTKQQIRFVAVVVIRSDKKTESFEAILMIASKRNKKHQKKTKNQSHYDFSGKVRIRDRKVYLDKIYMELEDGTRLFIPIIY